MSLKKQFQKAGRQVKNWNRIMLLSHARPDGDALGAMAALRLILGAMGHEATGFIDGEIPPRYAFLNPVGRFSPWNGGPPADETQAFDGIVIVDTCSWSQLSPAADFVRSCPLPKIVIDHHATRDDLSRDGAKDCYVIDPTAASACELIFEWCEEMGWAFDAPSAEALFTGMATDTGWFQYSNTNARTLRAAARLIEAGVQPHVLYPRLYASHSLARVRLAAEMLATLETHADGSIAIMTLTQDMFDRTGASKSDTEDLINEPMSASSVVASVLLVDLNEPDTRVSFRSKAPEVCGCDLDVSAVAARFGGGGHRRAAGARLSGNLKEVQRDVTEAIVQALEIARQNERGKER